MTINSLTGFFSFCIYITLQGRVELSQIFVFYPQRNIFWWGIHGRHLASTPNSSNQSWKLCYEEAIKRNIQPNTCRLADCFLGHKGCFITNVHVLDGEATLPNLWVYLAPDKIPLQQEGYKLYIDTCWPPNCVLVWSWSKDHSWSLHSLPLAKFWKHRWIFGTPLWINWFVLTLYLWPYNICHLMYIFSSKMFMFVNKVNSCCLLIILQLS